VTGLPEMSTDFSVTLEPGRFLSRWEIVILQRKVLFHQVSYSCLWQGSDGMSSGDSIKVAGICNIWWVCCRDKEDISKWLWLWWWWRDSHFVFLFDI